MIYVVTYNTNTVSNDTFTVISVEVSLEMMLPWTTVQFDTETSGLDAHSDKILTMQFGDYTGETQIVIDCASGVSPLLYKDVLEKKFLIGQNLKFDFQFLFPFNIIPTRFYDVMVADQVLYLGYPSSEIKYNLHDICERYLGIYLDKSVRGKILYLGVVGEVIVYGANDVKPLNKIMKLQMKKARELGMENAIKLECEFVRVVAYLEYCGIRLDEQKWKDKMEKDKQALDKALKDLNGFIVANAEKYPAFKKFITVNNQGDLWSGFNTEPVVNINWSSSRQVVKIASTLGFNTVFGGKETVLEKYLKTQKGICDEFLSLYFKYQEYSKVCSSFGQGHLNAVHPYTGRIHTVYRGIGAASDRMSCGSQNENVAVAKLKGIPPSKVSYPNIQQLPHDEVTRGCFVPNEGNLLIDTDYSAAEARLAGDIYNDDKVKEIFLKGLDSHSVYAKAFFPDKLKDVPVEDIKRLYPDLRQSAKGPEFALNFGGTYAAIMSSIGCSKEEAQAIENNYKAEFVGTAEFAKKASYFVRNNGYVLINPITGHRRFWSNHKNWLAEEHSYTKEFWTEYNDVHKGTGDYVHQQVKAHMKEASEWDRLARNAPTQGTCAIMLKESQINLLQWVIDRGYFGKILLCALVHDECLWEAPKEIAETFARVIEKEMLDTAAKYCKSLPIPAEAAIGDHWIH
jgi:DNA polymerase I-like protein with 3'-5' exonuclease and polymerase domains